MLPAFAKAAGADGAKTKPRRMLGICNNLGLLPDQFFPKEKGRDYKLSPYLEYLRDHREDFAVEFIHRRGELAGSSEDQPAARQSRSPTNTRFPWKRLYIRSKFRRLRLRRSSSESDSQTRCSCRRAHSAPSARTR